MSNYYSNPTANAAIGAVDREMKLLRKEAKLLRQRYLRGLLTPEEETRARRRFTGIYRVLLKNALRPKK